MSDARSSPRSVVGVFDSGVGGLSVLRALHRALPAARLHYVADSGHAPYGERVEHAMRRSLRIVEHLLQAGAQAIVVACNTATAVSIETLRERWPGVPFVGVEPGLKPALALTRSGRIGVLATTATLASQRYRRLVERHAGSSVRLVAQPCPGLADAIERGDPESDELRRIVERCCAPLREAAVDVVVLGCTHYPFAARQIAAALGEDVMLVDTAEAVARQAARVVVAAPRVDAYARPSARSVRAGGAPAVPLLETTGDVERLRHVASAWLDFGCEIRPLMLQT